MGEKEEVGVVGWVEVVVRDRRGRVKYRYGSPPPRRSRTMKGATKGGFLSSPLSKLVEGVKRLLGDPPIAVPAVSSEPACVALTAGVLRNIITNVGLSEMIKLVFGLGGTVFGYIAIGTGTAAESATDTALQAEIKRKAASKTQTTTAVAGDTCLLSATFSSADGLTGTSAVTEAGVFNAATGGVLLARKVFPAVNVDWDAGDSLTINYYVQLSR